MTRKSFLAKLRAVLNDLKRQVGYTDSPKAVGWVIEELEAISAKLKTGLPGLKERKRVWTFVTYVLSDCDIGETPLGQQVADLMEAYVRLDTESRKRSLRRGKRGTFRVESPDSNIGRME